jgi:hypothetical protein
MAKKKSPITVAGIRARTSANAASQRHPAGLKSKTKETAPSRPSRQPESSDAYSFVASKFRKPTAEGGLLWNSATQVCEVLWQVPKDVRKFGAVGSARKYISTLFFYLAQQVSEPA